MRNARQRNQSFGIVANGESYAPPSRVGYGEGVDRRSQVHLPSAAVPIAAMAEPVGDIEADEVEAALADAAETIHEAQLTETRAAPVAMAHPSSSYRSRASTLRNQPALRVLDGPGSRTAVVDAGELARTDPRLLSPSSQVAAENLQRAIARGGHFARNTHFAR